MKCKAITARWVHYRRLEDNPEAETEVNPKITIRPALKGESKKAVEINSSYRKQRKRRGPPVKHLKPNVIVKSPQKPEPPKKNIPKPPPLP